MYKTYDFTPYFGSAEVLANKFLKLYFKGQKPSFPIDPFRMLSDFNIPFAFRDLKRLEGLYIPPENEEDIAVVGINRSGVSALVKYPLHIVFVFFPCYFVHCNCFTNYCLLNSSEKQLTSVF